MLLLLPLLHKLTFFFFFVTLEVYLWVWDEQDVCLSAVRQVVA